MMTASAEYPLIIVVKLPIPPLSKCLSEVSGEKPKLEGVTYGSDLRLFTNHGKMPAVLYGPGDVRNAHAVNEYVTLEEVLKCTKVLALTISEWSLETR